MSKKKKQKTGPLKPSPKRLTAAQRNLTLDSLRGLAILLMIVDHVAGVFFSIRIEPDTLRMATRLSMPLFAVLMGYFLASSTSIRWNRLRELVVASAAINILYFYVYQELEILASLLACYGGYLLLGRHLVWCFATAYFFLVDPSQYLFDYAISVVLTCVAHGMILRIYGWRIASICGLLTLPAAIFVTTPTQYSIYFVLPAVWLVAWGSSHPRWSVVGIEALGRHPLTAYLTQYFIILGYKVLFLN